MPLRMVRNDITTMRVDAIVNAANESLLGGGGVDGAIHRAAGPQLLAECRTLGGCRTGQAKITGGYRLPARYVIHTVGPVWRGGRYGEKELLVSAYRTSLELAVAHDCQTVAFPLISSGVYGYPKDQALNVAVDTIVAFLQDHELTVYLVIFDRAAYTIGEKRFADIAAYLDARYTQDRQEPTSFSMASAQSVPDGLNEALAMMDESFSQMLLRKIDERGMTDVQCYKKANLDRRLFSKIRSDIHYRPSRATAMALAVALELPLDEARELLQTAGFAFSHASKSDIIVEYFIAHQNYNIFEINEALFAFDQELLGG
ncbi:MAG: O-acetyl-ADP-ribose deacetylase [Gemmiger sp.]|uniref:O-acetyl-ADP-ribose deacetylase n=1 Tax=Gemmiger sp. TaxID=2049027 RepID=UPI002E79C35E|nr:O-acetyl-ADP-ribose deacetylase [Gemmiger sp.]MEE0802011.1 O-acetyl-ADP-ribose deacetylase [Gemmiger sp.]